MTNTTLQGLLGSGNIGAFAKDLERLSKAASDATAKSNEFKKTFQGLLDSCKKLSTEAKCISKAMETVSSSHQKQQAKSAKVAKKTAKQRKEDLNALKKIEVDHLKDVEDKIKQQAKAKISPVTPPQIDEKETERQEREREKKEEQREKDRAAAKKRIADFDKKLLQERLNLIHETSDVLSDTIRGIPEALGGGVDKAVSSLLSVFSSGDSLLKKAEAWKEEARKRVREAVKQTTIGEDGKRTAPDKSSANRAQAVASTLEGLGKVLSTVAKLGKAFSWMGAIGQILMDARNQAVELNKTILDGTSGTDLFVGRAKDLHKELAMLREAALDYGHAWKFGTDAQEQLGILKAFQEQNVTFREMTKGITDRNEKANVFKEITGKTLTLSKLLGISANEMATKFAESFEELGVGKSTKGLSALSDKFLKIHQAAALSGFSTKNFFTTIMQGSNGMALYNYQVEQAAGLLIKFSNVLGKKAGPELLNYINNLFKGDSIQDRFRKIMVAGTANMRKVFKESSESIAGDFLKKFTDGDFAKTLQTMGVKIEGMDKVKDAKDLVKVLSEMKPAEQRKMISKIGQHNPEMARSLESVVEISKAQKGGLSQMARGMDSLDLGGKMQFALIQASTIFKKPISEMSAIQIAAYQQATGMSMEQIKQLERIENRFKGNFEVLQEQAGVLKKIKEKGEAATQEEKAQAKAILAKQQEQAKTYGAMVTQNGEIVAVTKKGSAYQANNNKKITKYTDLVKQQTEYFKEQATDAVPEQIALAREVVTGTLDLNKVMKNVVGYYLEKIYQVVEAVFKWFTGGKMSASEKKARDELIAIETKKEKDAKEHIEKLSERHSQLVTASKRETGDVRKKKEEEIKAVAKQIEEERANLSAAGLKKESLLGVSGASLWKGQVSSLSKEQIEKEALNNAQKAALLTGDKGAVQKIGEDKESIKRKEEIKNLKSQIGEGGGFFGNIKYYTQKLMKDEDGISNLEKIQSKIYHHEQAEAKKLEEKTTNAVFKAAMKMEQHKRQQVVESAEKAGVRLSEEDRARFLQTGLLDNKDNKHKPMLDFLKTQVPAIPGGTLNDFLIRLSSDGKVSLLNRFNPMDNIAVMGTKQGGGLQQMTQQQTASPAPAGKSSVVINIYGNEEKAYSVVKKALKVSGVI